MNKKALPRKAVDALETEVSDARRTIAADGYPMSIGELTNLYREGELVIRPEYQRLFRWSIEQRSRLIESILLGIPLPSIFVAQQEGGKWELVDGLQRVSTILELQGELRGVDGNALPPMVLRETKYLPALEGRRWEHANPQQSLSAALRLDIKRTKIDLKIIKRESSPQSKYDLFQRLNSYGSNLTPQELRSALLVAVSPEFLAWLEKLARHKSFAETTSLSERLLEERYDLELVVRFIVLHSRGPEQLSQAALRDLNQVLDREAVALATKSPRGSTQLEATFVKTFDTIVANGGDAVFRRWDSGKKAFVGSFLNTAYEIIALGLGYHVAAGTQHRKDLLEVAKEVWALPEMARGFSTGRSTEARLAGFVPLGRKVLTPKSTAKKVGKGLKK
ncbi:MAG: DUF262 domain-containing protein [Deltaproteobacteria bacterium]|nr:DUF262 domain-containing protein [Deltaproteobacteria bacterium]MBK8718770.1 DUF262 domain-containing protein [Deltaproteobacteria bacterium]MBP7286483.1 DUF262 domain-containing protein [Nannocystaceae bacterium]